MPTSFIVRVFAVMAATPQYTYQVLTKRAGRLARLAPDLPWPANVWMGVSVENVDVVHRVEHLSAVPAVVPASPTVCRDVPYSERGLRTARTRPSRTVRQRSANSACSSTAPASIDFNPY